MSSKVRVHIRADEAYPDYWLADDGDLEVEATVEQVERWRAAAAAYSEAQAEMGALYKAAEAVERKRREREKAEREAAERAERERLTRERQAVAEAREAAAVAMREQISASDGVVYDAEGRPVGRVRFVRDHLIGGSGVSVRIEP